MAKPYKGKKKRGGPLFVGLPKDMVAHPNFAGLSNRAKALLIPIIFQYHGHNNGDLCATLSVLKSHGWRSNDQLRKGLRELLDTGFLIQTRQGRRPNVPSLDALSWRAIDECGGKLEVHPTAAPPHTWKNPPP